MDLCTRIFVYPKLLFSNTEKEIHKEMYHLQINNIFFFETRLYFLDAHTRKTEL